VTERIVAVGKLTGGDYRTKRVAWQSPDLPAPTILATCGDDRRAASSRTEDGGTGWILVEVAAPPPVRSGAA
jgi:hypothetical protein